jgi:hypothetical protein
MVKLFDIILDFRTVERNDVSREVAMIKNKLVCACGDAVFWGIPCRHALAIATSERNFKLNMLPISERWLISAYQETDKLKDEFKDCIDSKGSKKSGKNTFPTNVILS